MSPDAESAGTSARQPHCLVGAIPFPSTVCEPDAAKGDHRPCTQSPQASICESACGLRRRLRFSIRIFSPDAQLPAWSSATDSRADNRRHRLDPRFDILNEPGIAENRIREPADMVGLSEIGKPVIIGGAKPGAAFHCYRQVIFERCGRIEQWRGGKISFQDSSQRISRRPVDVGLARTTTRCRVTTR